VPFSPPVVKTIRKFCCPPVATGQAPGLELHELNEFVAPVTTFRWYPAGASGA
jgi:hypothetical protein